MTSPANCKCLASSTGSSQKAAREEDIGTTVLGVVLEVNFLLLQNGYVMYLVKLILFC
jgi:hypothetical protein